MEDSVKARLFGTLTRREEFAQLSMDQQGELIVQLAEALGAFREATGLRATVIVENDAAAFECPDHPDNPEAMLEDVEFNDDHEGHFFDVRVWCPLCGAEFQGGLNRTERAGELL